MDRDEVEAFGDRLMEALTARDFETLEEILDPEMRLRSLITPIGREFVGTDGLRVYFGALAESFEGARWRFLDVVAFEADVAVVRVNFRARGRGSGIEIDEVHAHVWRFRDGRGQVSEVHQALDDALAAAALRS